MIYSDEEKRERLNDYHMFVGSDTAMLFRLHIYECRFLINFRQNHFKSSSNEERLYT